MTMLGSWRAALWRRPALRRLVGVAFAAAAAGLMIAVVMGAGNAHRMEHARLTVVPGTAQIDGAHWRHLDRDWTFVPEPGQPVPSSTAAFSALASHRLGDIPAADLDGVYWHGDLVALHDHRRGDVVRSERFGYAGLVPFAALGLIAAAIAESCRRREDDWLAVLALSGVTMLVTLQVSSGWTAIGAGAIVATLVAGFSYRARRRRSRRPSPRHAGEAPFDRP